MRGTFWAPILVKREERSAVSAVSTRDGRFSSHKRDVGVHHPSVQICTLLNTKAILPIRRELGAVVLLRRTTGEEGTLVSSSP